jgi:hypothetical protein
VCPESLAIPVSGNVTIPASWLVSVGEELELQAARARPRRRNEEFRIPVL